LHRVTTDRVTATARAGVRDDVRAIDIIIGPLP
jgi:hypothetical protein